MNGAVQFRLDANRQGNAITHVVVYSSSSETWVTRADVDSYPEKAVVAKLSLGLWGQLDLCAHDGEAVLMTVN